MSISPLSGQFRRFSGSAPMVQKAGHRPAPFGILARMTIRPYLNSALPSETIPADVISMNRRFSFQFSEPSL